MPPGSVQTCVTSPPYYGLRDYGTPPQVWGGDDACTHEWGPVGPAHHPGQVKDSKWQGNPDLQKGQTAGSGQFCGLCGAWLGHLGLEPTPDLYIQHLVEVFREVHRVLRPDGTLWLNLGDSYAAQRGGTLMPAETLAGGEHGLGDGATRRGRTTTEQKQAHRDARKIGLKHKDLIGIPWMAAFALRTDGWYLRMDNIWAKGVSGQKELTRQLVEAMTKAKLNADQIRHTMAHLEPYVGNCMPESVKDRSTRSHEYMFLLSKSKDYYYDGFAVQEAPSGNEVSAARRGRQDFSTVGTAALQGTGYGQSGTSLNAEHKGGGRNRRSVWVIPTRPFKGAHFATFPPGLVEPLILASTPEFGSCAACGTPYERVVVKGKPLTEQQAACGADSTGGYSGTAQKDYAPTLAQDPSATKARILAGMVEKSTTGWKAACKCASYAVPATVIDPFGGSGTVGAVAELHGRRAIVIELNPEYEKLQDVRRKDVRRALRRDLGRPLLAVSKPEDGGQPHQRREPAVPDDEHGGTAGDADPQAGGEGRADVPMGDDPARE